MAADGGDGQKVTVDLNIAPGDTEHSHERHCASKLGAYASICGSLVVRTHLWVDRIVSMLQQVFLESILGFSVGGLEATEGNLYP